MQALRYGIGPADAGLAIWVQIGRQIDRQYLQPAIPKAAPERSPRFLLPSAPESIPRAQPQISAWFLMGIDLGKAIVLCLGVLGLPPH